MRSNSQIIEKYFNQFYVYINKRKIWFIKSKKLKFLSYPTIDDIT